MGTEQQAWKQIEQLHREMERRDRECEKNAKILAEKYKKEMHDLQILQQRRLNEAKESVRNEILTEIKLKEAALDAKISTAEKESFERYKQSRRELEEVHWQIAKAEEQFKRDISEICEELHLKEENEREYAARAVDEASKAIDEIKNEPHEIFFPSKLTLYNSEVENASKQMDINLCQAAIATAVSAKYAIKRFLLDILKMKNLWKETFEELAKSVMVVDEKIKHIEREVCKLNNISEDLAHIELNYFTKGKYGQFYDCIKEILKQVEECNRVGVEKYLKNKDALTIEQMDDSIEKLKDSNQQIRDLCDQYDTNRLSYEERSEWGTKLKDLFENRLGYTILDYGFEMLSAIEQKKDYIIGFAQNLQKEPKDQNLLSAYTLCVKKEDFFLTIEIEPYAKGDLDYLNRIHYYVVTGTWAPRDEFAYIKKRICECVETDVELVQCVNNKVEQNGSNILKTQSTDSMKEFLKKTKNVMY